MRYWFRQRQWPPHLFSLLILVGIIVYALIESSLDEFTYPDQAGCFVAAFLWILYTARDAIRSITHVDFRQMRIHPAWLLVLVALILRYSAFSIFPPANQTGFEELQTGTIVYRMLLTNELPIEFRFTNLLGLAGLSTDPGASLASLRFPFQIAGIISLLLMVLALRSLKVSWLPTLLITFIAATMRFLVIASGVADELFAGVPFLTAFLFCMIRSETSERNASFWTATAGVFGGILMYEYTAYRVPVGIGLVWLVWQWVFNTGAEKATPKSPRWSNVVSFIIPLSLIALPTIIQTLRNAESSIFLEAFVRHRIERAAFIPNDYLFQIQQYVLGLTGWPSAVSAYYTPVDEPVILPAVGWLFAISTVYCLIFASQRFVRVMVLTVICTVLSAGLLANNANIGRMAPIIPILLLTAGVFLDRIYLEITRRYAQSRSGAAIAVIIPNRVLIKHITLSDPQTTLVKPQTMKESGAGSFTQIDINFQRIGQLALAAITAVTFVFLIWQVTRANLEALKRMAGDPQVINEYVNDDYSVCAYIGSIASMGQRAYIYSPDGIEQCTSDRVDGWYFGGHQPEIHHVTGEYPSPDSLVPGDLVVLGTRNRALTEAELSQLIELGNTTDSLISLQTSRNLAGRITAASFCFKCGDLASGQH